MMSYMRTTEKERYERCVSGTISNDRGHRASEHALDTPLLVNMSQHVKDSFITRRILSLPLNQEQDLCPLDGSRDQRRRNGGHETGGSDLRRGKRRVFPVWGSGEDQELRHVISLDGRI